MSTLRSFCPEPGGVTPRIKPHEVSRSHKMLIALTTRTTAEPPELEIFSARASCLGAEVALSRDHRAARAASAMDVAYKTIADKTIADKTIADKTIADKTISSGKEFAALEYANMNFKEDIGARPPNQTHHGCPLCDENSRNEPVNQLRFRVVQPYETLSMARVNAQGCDTESVTPTQEPRRRNWTAALSTIGRGSDVGFDELARGIAAGTYSRLVDGDTLGTSYHVNKQASSLDEPESVYTEGNMAMMARHEKEKCVTLTKRNFGDLVKAALGSSEISSRASREDSDLISIPLPSLLYLAVVIMTSWPAQTWTQLLTEAANYQSVVAPKPPTGRDSKAKTLSAIMKRSPPGEHFYPLGDPG